MMISFLFASAVAAIPTAAPDTQPINCSMCAQWNEPHAPFRVHGNTWYVGPKGLAAVLIDSGEGLVLLDGALPQSAQQIADNLETIGFDIADVKWIVNSHAHFDHAGGIAALQRMSGARVAASANGAESLRRGNVLDDDPQAGMGAEAMRYPPIADVTPIADGETIEIGDVRLTANHTPGHTPGGVTWTWRSCVDQDCLDIVYADSLTAVSAQDFRFSRDPERVAVFQRSIRSVGALPCDILIATHPGSTGLFDRQRATDAQTSPYVDRQACRAYAERSAAALQKRLGDEAAGVDAD